MIVLYFPLRVLHTLAISTTDQNLFSYPKSGVVLIKDLMTDDGVRFHPGDFLLLIGEEKCRTFEECLTRFPREDRIVSVEIADSISNIRKRISISSNDLRESITGIPPAARILSVQKDGASDRAGLRPGDLIVSINGQGFASIFEADALMRKIKPGETATYRILRRMKPMDINIQLANFGIPFTMILGAIGGFLFLIAGLFLGLSRPGIKTARRLSEAFLFLSGFAFLLLLDFSGIDTQSRIQVSLLRFVFGALGITLLIHVRWYFPSERRYFTRRKWIMFTPWIIALLSLISLLILAGKTPVFGLIQGVSFLLLGCLFLFPGIIRLVYRKQKSLRDRELSKTIRYYDRALFITPIIIPFFRQGFYLLVVLYFLLPFIYGLTIARHHLFGLQIKLNKTTQYSFYNILVVILLLAAGLLWAGFLAHLSFHLPKVYLTSNAIELVEGVRNQAQALFFERVAIIFMALAGFILLRWIFKKTSFFLKKGFHRQGYDYRQAAQDLTDALFNRFNIKGLSKTLATKISELMEVQAAGVLIFNGSNTVIGEKGTRIQLNLEKDSAELKKTLRAFHSTFSIDYLEGSLKKSLIQSNIHFLCPVRNQNEPLGCILVGAKRSEACLNEEDFSFLKAAAGQSAIAMENAILYGQLASQERMKHELEIARRVQLSSLPQVIPVLPEFDIAADSIPALEVGGDYFDFLEVQDDQIHFMLADVSGKGTSAAFYMSKIQGIFRALAMNHLSPRELLLRANPIIFNSMEKSSFVTALGLELNAGTHTATFARAGHIGLYHYNAGTGVTEIYQPPGMALGICEGALFENNLSEKTISFDTGDVFALISDGLSEAMNTDRIPFGEEAIGTALTRLCSGSAGEIMAGIMEEIHRFTDATPQHDDQTLIIVKIRSNP
jgi:serine phosphatase RsbU (regulator of sigma subunit)